MLSSESFPIDMKGRSSSSCLLQGLLHETPVFDHCWIKNKFRECIREGTEAGARIRNLYLYSLSFSYTFF